MEQLIAESGDVSRLDPQGCDKLVQPNLLVWIVNEPALNSLAKRLLDFSSDSGNRKPSADSHNRQEICLALSSNAIPEALKKPVNQLRMAEPWMSVEHETDSGRKLRFPKRPRAIPSASTGWQPQERLVH
jgi:hypothetical protein